MTPRPPILIRTAYDPTSPFAGRDRGGLPDRLTRVCNIDLRARILDATRYDIDFDAADGMLVLMTQREIQQRLARAEDDA